MYKVLIVDDNKSITMILGEYAKKNGFSPIFAYNGEEALLKFYNENPDIILIDIMMPKKDGFAVCKKIRETSSVPIIIISAKGEDYEKIMGLDLGADDYIVKPFSSGEVIARINAIMRRVTIHKDESNTLYYDNLAINMDNYTVSINSINLSLTKKEIELLYTLAKNHNKVFTRDNLLNSIWGYNYYGDSRTVDTHIKRLRAKLSIHDHPSWSIVTIHGVGYKFEVNQVG